MSGYRFAAGALLVACLCLTACGQTLACTLYGAAGADFVAGGGVLFAKVRDWKPQEQTVRAVHPETGYNYFALFTKRFAPVGINEHGLAVAMSTAGTITREERHQRRFRSPDGLRLNEYILRHCRTVKEALALPDTFWQGPVNFILGDRTQIAVVEVLPNGRHTVRETSSGTLAHTNHYLEPDSLAFNQMAAVSSYTRYTRIKELLDKKVGQLRLEDIIQFAEDRNAGPDKSIWRTGSRRDGTQSLAAFAVYIPPEGEPAIYLKYREHLEESGQERVLRLSLTEALLMR